MRWWGEQHPTRRRQLQQLPEGQPLPQAVAADLWRYGVSCPLVLLNERGRVVRRALPPRALLNLVAAATS